MSERGLKSCSGREKPGQFRLLAPLLLVLYGDRALAVDLPNDNATQRLFDPQMDRSRPSGKTLVIPKPKSIEREQSLDLPKPPAKAGTGAQAAGPKTVVLKSVVFDGNTLLPEQELHDLAAQYLNRPLSGAELEELRYKTTLLYVNKGYINSGAVVPDQTLKDGLFRLKIIEGRLTDVQVTGQEWLNEGYIKSRLLGDTDQALNTKDLQQRYLRLLQDPLFDRLNGSLMPGLHPGEAILNLRVKRARPYGAYLGFDNAAPPSIGSYTGRVGAWVNNLTSFGDRIDFNFSVNGGSFSYNTGIDIPLNAAGTKFSFRYTDSEASLIEEPINTLNIQSRIISYDGQLSHPVLWDLDQKLLVGLNFAVRSNLSTIDGQPLPIAVASNGRTQATVLRLWQDYMTQRNVFDIAFRSTFSAGLDALGATAKSDPTVGDGRFFAWLGQAVGRYRPFDNGAYFSLSSAVQLADEPLLALEQIAVGGASTVRGFRQNALVRDEGFYASLEFGYPLFGGEPGAKHSLYLIPFMDYGGAWNLAGEEKPTYLHSAGLGMEWRYSTLMASFYWAGKINQSDYALSPGTPRDPQDEGLHFQVNWKTP